MPADSFGREIARKLIHVFALLYLVGYFYFADTFSHQAGLLFLAGLLVVLIILEHLRLQHGVYLPLLRYLYKLRRTEELEGKIGAEVYFLLGVIIALAAFDTVIATAAVFMTVFGDTAAALAGKRFGRVRPAVFGGKKSIEGFLAALLVNLTVGMVILSCGPECPLLWQSGINEPWSVIRLYTSGSALWPLALVMASAASLTELAVSNIDDNLTIPVISGAAGEIFLLCRISFC
ncbi:MAG: phosphatidate cytidylyltransferase [Gemmatimonadota bacterium]|nr:phosphatidate cytidylyltransferase [Gemmatimonadota bacterium]